MDSDFLSRVWSRVPVTPPSLRHRTRGRQDPKQWERPETEGTDTFRSPRDRSETQEGQRRARALYRVPSLSLSTHLSLPRLTPNYPSSCRPSRPTVSGKWTSRDRPGEVSTTRRGTPKWGERERGAPTGIRGPVSVGGTGVGVAPGQGHLQSRPNVGNKEYRLDGRNLSVDRVLGK